MSKRSRTVDSPGESLSKKRKSLSEQLASLTDPTPKDVDTEDPHWDYALDYDTGYEEEVFTGSDKLNVAPTRSRMVSATPDDLGTTYRGKRAKRSEVSDGQVVMNDIKNLTDFEEVSEDTEGDELITPSANLDEDSDGDSSDGGNDGDSGDDDDGDDDNADDEDVHNVKALPTTRKQSQADELEKMAKEMEESDSEEEDRVKAIGEESSGKDKAVHTLNQRILWDSLVDLRVGLQPLMDMALQLPLPPDHKAFCESESGEKVSEAFSEVQESLSELMMDLLNLQNTLQAQEPAVYNESNYQPVESIDDQLWSTLDSNYNNLVKGAGPIIDKWQAKTIYASGVNSKKFKQINQSIVGQVETILAPESHGRQTKLNRSQTRNLAKPKQKPLTLEPNNTTSNNNNNTTTNTQPGTTNSSQMSLSTMIDPEIYNDHEFLETLLRDHIDTASINKDGPTDTLISQQFLNILRLRKQKRAGSRQVDRRASKGRKLRYQVHEKLVSFMAPVTNHYPSQEAPMANHLFGSLFGVTQKSN